NPKSTEKPRIYIDSILYSPDTLRLYAFVVIEFKGRMMDESYLEEIARYYVDYPDKSFFDGKAVIAYRDDYRDIWKLYPYDHYLPFNGESYSDIRYALRQYYFNEFKKNGETILHKNTLRFKYNVDDPEFWTEDCIVWQKGLRIPGYYNFQTRGNITRESLNPIIPELDIIYPDSLLRLFPGFQTSQDKK
ncbi:MAG: hypothetical protein NW226_12865, partial [Microscillaceae bacterium]|nr:hypothetical protein [Microscillaceae bacterium]